MNTLRTISGVASFALLFVAAACSSSSSSGSSDAGSKATDSGSGGVPLDASHPHDAGAKDSAAAAIPATLKLNVPSSFKGTPNTLAVIAVNSPNAMDPSAFLGILYSSMNDPSVLSKITPGATVTLTGAADPSWSPLYPLAILYMQGGGSNGLPSPGIDYVAMGMSPVTVSGSSVDLGTLTLSLATDGGP